MCRATTTIFLLLIMAASVAPAWSQDYIVMGTPLVNIRSGPSTDHYIIGRAEKGDIYEVLGQAGPDQGWYKIAMFSGEPRYVVVADFVYPLTTAQLSPGHGMDYPLDSEQGRGLYQDIAMGKARASREADEIVPASIDAEHNQAFRMIREDGIILEMMHIRGIQPGLYSELMEMGQNSGW